MRIFRGLSKCSRYLVRVPSVSLEVGSVTFTLAKTAGRRRSTDEHWFFGRVDSPPAFSAGFSDGMWPAERHKIMSQQLDRRWAVAVVLGLAVSQAAWAQRGGGGGRGFGRLFGGVSKAQLATLDDVQTELKLTPKQITDVDKINADLREKRRDLFSGGFGGSGQIRTQMDQLNRDASAEVDKILDDAQRQRLQEIDIQVNGVAALGEPSVSEQLKLTAAQQKQLEEVRAANSKAAKDARQTFRDMSRQERRQKFREMSDAASEKLLGVLTPEQKTQFEAMKGAPIDVDTSQLFRRGGGRRRPNN